MTPKKEGASRRVVGTSRAFAPASYEQLLVQLKSRIRAAQLKAARAVNAELVVLYWGIGRDILDRQKKEGWGAQVIDRLSADLRRDFPEMTASLQGKIEVLLTLLAERYERRSVIITRNVVYSSRAGRALWLTFDPRASAPPLATPARGKPRTSP